MATLDHLQARTGPNKARVWYGTPGALQFIDVPGGSNRQCADIAAERLGLYGERFAALCVVTVIPTPEQEEEYRASTAKTIAENLKQWAREHAKEELTFHRDGRKT